MTVTRPGDNSFIAETKSREDFPRIEFGEIRIGNTARAHLDDCLDRNWISMGPKTKLLESRFSKLMGCDYGVAVSSGTAAITAMTLALPEIAKKKVVRGKSKVICPGLGFIANSTGIVSGRLIPHYVDIRAETLNINEDLVEYAIDEDTVAIYAIGTMGRPCEMDRLKEIADRYNLVLFSDSCEDYGSKINGEFSHKRSIAGCSSFFQAHLVQAGEGSVVFTDDENLRDLLVSIRSHGRKPDDPYFEHIRFGNNFKTTDLCSAIGLEGVDEFHENIVVRKRIWRELVEFSEQFADQAWFSSEPDHMEVMPHGFSITLKQECDKPLSLLTSLFDRYNIHWKKNFGASYSHGAMKEFKGFCSVAEYCGERGVHIGCHRYMTKENVDRIKRVLTEFFSG